MTLDPKTAIVAATEALAAAVANETKAREASDRAAAAVQSAKVGRNALIDDAAAGKPTRAQDVRAAEEATREAEIGAEIAARVHAVATRKRHEAEISAWWAEANVIQARIGGTAKLLVAADDSVQAAAAALRLAEAERQNRFAAYAAAHQEGKIFNGNKGVRAINPILAALDSGVEHPRVAGAAATLQREFRYLPQPQPTLEQARADALRAASAA